MMSVSFGESITNPDQLFKYHSLKELLSWQCTSEKQECLIEDLRRIEDKKERNKLKKRLPYIVASHFDPDIRNTKNLVKSNGFIFDLDGLDDVEGMFKKLTLEPFVHFMFRSPSGNGLKFGVLLETDIKDSELYTKVYKYCSKKLSEFYNMELDHTSDCARACFLSCDPDYYYNADSAKFPIKYDVEKPTPQYVPTEFKADEAKEIEIIREICQTLTTSSYEDWITAACALSTLGAIGEDFFVMMSTGKGYKDSISSIRRKFKSFSAQGGVGIGSLFHLADKAGIDIKEIRKRHYSN